MDKLKDAFLANTSHELRTPLHGIIGLAESLIEGATGPLPNNTKSNLSMIVNSGKRLAHLINDILDFSKLKSKDIPLNLKAVDLRTAVDVTLTMSAVLVHHKSIEMINDIADDLPPVIADEDRLQQILFNLIGNAIKFTDAGCIQIIATQTGSIIAVSIIDNGIGIEADQQTTIFNAFEQANSSTTREYGGTGLGLTVTRQLVELHGWTIKVESTHGKGSTFTFTLAVSEQAVCDDPLGSGLTPLNRVTADNQSIVVTQPNAASANPIAQRLTQKDPFQILVVDDDPVNQQVLINQLSGLNYYVSLALSGKQALEQIHGLHPFDLVLLDIMMPRMSGYEVAQKIRQNYSANELPILMLTAKNQLVDLVEGFACGANDYLTKPFSKDELLARVKMQLNLAQTNAAYARFLPAEFLKMLDRESIVDVRLGDQAMCEMTILFLDIRGFTTLCEHLTPKQNFDFINECLSHIIPAIRANGGFIDKYIGDAVMALFPASADDAVNASVAILKQMQVYNKQRQSQNSEAIHIGIGLHTGTLMLGTIGDHYRMDGTVISDAVNLAARIEGLTKIYGVSLMLSDACFGKLSLHHSFGFRHLGRVQVKGKEQVLAVYEIFDGDQPRLLALKRDSIETFINALYKYHEKDFETAAHLFKQVLTINPDDQTAALYHQRCAQFM
ncbi:MAG: ATP-binding protein, partial [Psychrosphaera sp.]|nr:ATP-binding protein [Psychrosphaera sp.]